MLSLEEYIIENIQSGKWKINHKLPVETKLVEQFGISKMTVRKIIAKLREKNMLYTKEGQGVFVSSFHQYSLIKKLSDQLGADETKYIHSDIEIPDFFSKNYSNEIFIDKGRRLSYLKLYYKDGQIIAYTLNWLNNCHCKYSYNKLFNKNVDIHCNRDYETIVSINKLEPATDKSKKYLGINAGLVPTTYSYYIDKSHNIIMLRVTKVKPEHFEVFSNRST